MSSDEVIISKDEADEMIEAFEIFDRNKDGVISKDELGPVLRALGQNPTEADLQTLLEKADTDGNGNISREEYIELIKDYVKDPAEIEKELKSALSIFDKKGTGKIHVDQLRSVLKNIGEPLSDFQIDALLAVVKKDKRKRVKIDGKINMKSMAADLRHISLFRSLSCKDDKTIECHMKERKRKA